MIMRLQFAALLVALSVFALSAMGCKDKEQSELNTDTNVEVNISDPEIQAVFTRLNAFRLSDEANYLDKDNSTVISLVGQLKALELDADLCKAAQVRSNELLKKWSPTACSIGSSSTSRSCGPCRPRCRPSRGTSACWAVSCA